MAYDFRKAFTEARRRWGGNGSGSTPQRTSKLAAALPDLFARHNVRRVIDLGCGEVTWMAPIAAQLEWYLGVDVVPEVIELNQRQHPELAFQVIAGPRDELPEADLVICRDCLAHLPSAVAIATIRQASTAAPLVLMTSSPMTSANYDITRPGEFRPINLQRRPFHLDDPDEWVQDSDNKALGLWSGLQ